jgi:aspartokinase/homoserine dehydrogenase 1
VSLWSPATKLFSVCLTITIKLKHLSRRYNAPFLFETNVGAGLPIIDTVKNLVASGDQVNKIQAVLSGSLNFIFNNFDENNSFEK